MFHVGQLVVCVDDMPHGIDTQDKLCGLSKGQIYTIRRLDDFIFNYPIAPLKAFGMWLEEIDRTIPGSMPDQPFGAQRFRPVVTTDISIFEAMLVPTPKEKELAFADDPGIERRG